MADDDLEKLRPYSWPELLTRPRREQLVDEILFTKGVTTLVAQSGDGKTTYANSVGLTVATGGTWGGKIIKPRPLVWCAGEGQDDMRPMYEAWMQFHADAPTPFGFWLDEAIDFSSDRATKQFIELLNDMKMPEALIVSDALADHIAGLDENSSLVVRTCPMSSPIRRRPSGQGRRLQVVLGHRLRRAMRGPTTRLQTTRTQVPYRDLRPVRVVLKDPQAPAKHPQTDLRLVLARVEMTQIRLHRYQ